MKSSRRALRKATITAINEVLAANSINAAVLSVATKEESLPYVRLGRIFESDTSDKAEDTSFAEQPLAVYAGSSDEAEIIMEIIQERLTNDNLLVLDSPFTVLSQKLGAGYSAEQDLTSESPIYMAPIRVDYFITHGT